MMISLTAGKHMYVEVNCCEGMHEIAAMKARRLAFVPSMWLHGECGGRCQVKGALDERFDACLAALSQSFCNFICFGTVPKTVIDFPRRFHTRNRAPREIFPI